MAISPNKNLEGSSAHSEQASRMQSYYRMQSKIYDATRWSFLFGRRTVIRNLPLDGNSPIKILEVGCGTGKNLAYLAQTFPKAQLTGLDVSQDMIRLAGKRTMPFQERVKLLHQPYQAGDQTFSQQMDVILFSYSLTMINPQWKDLLEQAKSDLKPGGYAAVVDFHNSPFQWFKNHMSNHHVRMDGHLIPLLQTLFRPLTLEIRSAYGGIWHYCIFVGQKE